MKSKPEPLIVAEARKHLGYRAQPQRRSAVQHKAFQGMPWNGSFVNRVAQDAGLDEASFVSTVNALGYFLNRNRVYQTKVRPGDIVFFNFATDPLNMFEQPHVGIVTDTSKWKTEGVIRTIEGETAPGTAQGSQLVDGIFERVRYRHDILGFVRPRPRASLSLATSVPIKLSYFKSNPKTRARTAEVVQSALRRVGFTGFRQRAWDGYTRSAFANYARNRSFVANRGEPDQHALSALGQETGEFEIRE